MDGDIGLMVTEFRIRSPSMLLYRKKAPVLIAVVPIC